MRLIDADKLIDIITNSADLGGVWGQVLKAVKDAFIRLIRTMPNVNPEPQWIPCSERLPEKNGVYLVCYEDVTVPLDWFNGKWFFYKSNPAVEETGTIIAWMPLPEPARLENV